mmetsp:Transcript_60052/g.147663  ORF Transcript_60052/g.147663 Transcript_60052/m.147663 type:complete len:222 (+) Transcript_60052:252-917(+)
MKNFFEKIKFSPFAKTQKIFLNFYQKCLSIFWETEKLEQNFLRKLKIFKIKNNFQKNNFLRFIFWIQKKFLVSLLIIKQYFSCSFFQKNNLTQKMGVKNWKKNFWNIDNIKAAFKSIKAQFFFSSKNKNLCVLVLKLFPSMNVFDLLMKKPSKYKLAQGKQTNIKPLAFFYNSQIKNIKKIFLKSFLVNKKLEIRFVNFIFVVHCSYAFSEFFSFFSKYHF